MRNTRQAALKLLVVDFATPTPFGEEHDREASIFITSEFDKALCRFLADDLVARSTVDITIDCTHNLAFKVLPHEPRRIHGIKRFASLPIHAESMKLDCRPGIFTLYGSDDGTPSNRGVGLVRVLEGKAPSERTSLRQLEPFRDDVALVPSREVPLYSTRNPLHTSPRECNTSYVIDGSWDSGRRVVLELQQRSIEPSHTLTSLSTLYRKLRAVIMLTQFVKMTMCLSKP
jgi:hypothetical protein